MTPAQKRRNAWLAALIIVAPLLWTIPIFFYLKAETRYKNATCQENLRTLNTAIEGFARAHQNRFPGAQEWQAMTADQSTKTLHCPSDPNPKRASSYALNANLMGKKRSEITNPHDVILLYETNATSAAPFGDGEDMADIGKEKSGQGRHNKIGYRFNYFLMADGSIREAGTPEEKKPLRWSP
jgi:hypothetical protein